MYSYIYMCIYIGIYVIIYIYIYVHFTPRVGAPADVHTRCTIPTV